MTTLTQFPPYLANRRPMTQETRVLLGSAFSSKGSNQSTLNEPSENSTEKLNDHPHQSIPIDRYKLIKRKLRRSAKKHWRFQSKLHAPILTPPSKIDIADTWGDLPMTPSLSTRIVLQNINGIRQHGQFADAHVISEYAVTIEASIVGLTEANIDWNHRGTRMQCKQIFQRYWQRVNVATSSSDHRFDRVYHSGGSVIGACGYVN
jgi:hypothetical protein